MDNLGKLLWIRVENMHASRILKMSASYQDSLRSMLNRLAPMQIGKYNQLQEWLEDLDNPNVDLSN